MASNEIKPIRTEKDYESAHARIEELMEAVPGTVEFDELDVLTDLVELYESKHVPMGYPSPVAEDLRTTGESVRVRIEASSARSLLARRICFGCKSDLRMRVSGFGSKLS